MRSTLEFVEIPYQPRGYYAIVGVCAAAMVAGWIAAGEMADAGHHITGMSNRIVWGLPHVFALFLILAAAGSLIVASIATVWGRSIYKRLARLSCVLALALLAGGLTVLGLDLGQPGALVRSLSTLNFTSIFSLNLVVYTGFFLLAGAHLWMLMEYRMNRYARPIGVVAFLWQILLATDVGSVFGVLVARQGYDSAIIAPLSVAMSLTIGTAVFILVLMAAMAWTGRPCGDAAIKRLGRLLGLFILAAFYLVAMQHIIGSYGQERQGFENFILRDGGVYTTLFWWGQVFLGGLIPLAILFLPSTAGQRDKVAIAAALALVGGFAWLYVLIIGGQAYPLDLFPGMATSSGALDGQIAPYAPSWPEVFLGVGGVALAALFVSVAVKVLAVLPVSLADAEVDPHFRPPPEPEEEPDAADETADDEAADETPEPA
jgi:Ni/Fe-hydrogenase subunit HybB-like protein